MANYLVKAIGKKVIHADLTLPGSKSITNRAFILAALAEGKTELNNILISDDTVYMNKALKELGVPVEVDEGEKRAVIHGGKRNFGDHQLFVGNAGTAMRFLASYLCLGKGELLLDGDERMRQRPIQDLLSALNQLGCDVKSEPENGCPPVVIKANGLPGGKCRISGKNSSQYISSLLMTAPYSDKGVAIETAEGVSSVPYIDMTIQMMKQFGVKVSHQNYKEFKVLQKKYHSIESYWVEPDASSASYFLAAGAILSGSVTIRGIGYNSLQGDSKFAEYLALMGCNISYGEDSVTLESDGQLTGVDVDMNAVPDLVPTLAIAALFAKGPTRIRNVANLRIKESDRIAVLAAEMKKLGADVNEFSDGLEIFPKKNYNNALIFTYNDHRIAMAFSIAGLMIPGIEIENPACVGKSFPEFYEYLEQLIVK